ncbi:MAG: two-component regulator propeller domain-containing protein [Bacteroidota bacterium]
MQLLNRNLWSKTLLGLALIGILLASILGCNKSSTGGGAVGPIWVTFNKANHQLVGDHVNFLYTDSDGIVWIANDSGASYFNHGTWSSFVTDLQYMTYYNGGEQAASTVNSITQGLDRSIWFALNGGGIARYNQFAQQLVWRRYTTSVGRIPYDVVNGVAHGQIASSGGLPGEVWCATLIGVGHFIPAVNEGGVWVDFTTDNSTLPSNTVRAIALNINDNSVWFGSQDPHANGSSCVVHVDANLQWEPAQILPPPYDLPIVSIAFDAHNIGWFAKWQGVSSLNTKTSEWTHYTNESTKGMLPLGNVNVVTTDYDVTRWFGTNAGLVRMVDTTWTKFNRLNTPQLPSDTVTALAYDRSGNLWIGTPHGVAVYNPAGTRFY